MKRSSVLPVLVAIAILACVAPVTAGEDQALPAFERLKGLVGQWRSKGPDGAAVSATYRLVSAGTVLMEEMSAEGMVTMYHPDGDTLLMTHYCAGNNQPRMRASGLAADGSRIVFSFQDVSNLAAPGAAYMSDLAVTFKDADHFSQEWTHTEGGSKASWTFEWERVK